MTDSAPPGGPTALVPAGAAARHELLERIGAGGSGAVYRARRRSDGAPRAVKVLHRRLLDSAARRAFARECGALERLADVAGIVTLHEAGVDEDGQAWLVSSLCAGNLGERLASLGPLHPDEVRALGARVARALAAAHRIGIVHGDVKPANVFVDADGEALLGDFGACADLDATLTGGLALSLAYAAPETIERGERGVRSDLYGLGATLHHLLSGEPPFGAEPGGTSAATLAERVRRATRDTPPPLSPDDAPPALRALVGELLARDPSARPADAASVARRLERLPHPSRARDASDRSRAGSLRSTGDGVRGAGQDGERASALPRTGTRTGRRGLRHGLAPARSRTGAPSTRLALGVTLALGILLTAAVVTRPRPAAAERPCGGDALLCEGFENGLDGWEDHRQPRDARLETSDGGHRGRALTLLPADRDVHGASYLSRRLPGPAPGEVLRVRARVLVEQSSPAYFWMNLLQLADDRGRFWSLNFRHFTHPEIAFDVNHHDPRETHVKSEEATRAHPFDAWLCTEIVIDPGAPAAIVLHVDGEPVARSATPLSKGTSRHFMLSIGSASMETPATAPIVHVDDLAVETGDDPLCR